MVHMIMMIMTLTSIQHSCPHDQAHHPRTSSKCQSATAWDIGTPFLDGDHDEESLLQSWCIQSIHKFIKDGNDHFKGLDGYLLDPFLAPQVL